MTDQTPKPDYAEADRWAANAHEGIDRTDWLHAQAYRALRDEVEALEPFWKLVEQNDALRAEVERLKASIERLVRDGEGLEAELESARAEVIQKLDKEDRCLDCCSELAIAGPPGVGGEPSLICLYCESQEQLSEARAENAALRAKVDRLTARGIEDMQHEIVTHKAEVERLRARVQSLLMRHNANHGDGQSETCNDCAEARAIIAVREREKS